MTADSSAAARSRSRVTGITRQAFIAGLLSARVAGVELAQEPAARAAPVRIVEARGHFGAQHSQASAWRTYPSSW
jgi:hypothetical protein